MQFVVPQFIDVEDKILGPLSVRQFIILIFGAGFIIAAYRLADFELFLLEAFVIIVFTMAFAFIKVNGRPFHQFLVNFFQTLRKPRLRVWHRLINKEDIQLPKVTPPPKKKAKEKKQPTASRLHELSLIVDTGGAYKQDDSDFNEE